ncbi:hypothetical protein ACEWY4_002333 [Coilia grayii]|uniref:Uncharacterized protein n=1 Tax=Coilia grayii TaxID=363190 RepID=A0ABD1KN75_9TELE
MMKTEAPSAASSSASSSLRSSSPHRNAYEAGMQALKQATDTLNSATNGEDVKDGKARPTGRGRRYGSNVHRIKNMFMQMGTPPGEEDDPSKVSDQVRLSIPRTSSLNENMDRDAAGLKVSERASRFDAKSGGGTPIGAPAGYSKLQEMRKIFEQRHLQEKQAATNRILLKKERASGFQDGRLDVVVRFNGSTESLDSLEPAAAGGPTEAVSPTVSQLSAVFERAELRNNVHRSSSASPLSSRGVSPIPGKPAPPPPPSSKVAAKKVRIFPPQDAQREEGGAPGKGQDAAPGSPRNRAQTQAERGSAQAPQVADQAASAHSCGKTEPRNDAQDQPAQEVGVQGAEQERGATSGEQAEAGSPDAGSRLVQAEVHASLENGEAPGGPQVRISEDVAEWPAAGLLRDEDDLEEESRRDDYSEGDLVDISAYSGLGDDSGGSQLDEDEEVDDETYEPESSCSEIAGLPVEEEPPSNRKIRFSVDPIKTPLRLCSDAGPARPGPAASTAAATLRSSTLSRS